MAAESKCSKRQNYYGFLKLLGPSGSQNQQHLLVFFSCGVSRLQNTKKTLWFSFTLGVKSSFSHHPRGAVPHAADNLTDPPAGGHKAPNLIKTPMTGNSVVCRCRWALNQRPKGASKSIGVELEAPSVRKQVLWKPANVARTW